MTEEITGAGAGEPEEDLSAVLQELEALEEEGRWADLVEVSSAMVRERGATWSPDERAEVLFRLGAAHEMEGDEGEAAEVWQRALSADPGHRRGLLAMGNLLFRRGDLQAAEKTYRTLLARHRGDLDGASAAEAYYRLAKIRIEEVGDRERARAVVEKALSAQPSHRAARRLLIDLHRAAGNWPKVVAHERRLLDFEDDEGLRFSALLSLGDTARTELESVAEAEVHYEEAAALRPDDPLPLRRLYDLHSEHGLTQATLADLARLAGLTHLSAAKRAGWHALTGRAYRDDLDDVETAVACFNQALDFDPDAFEVFAECNELYTARGEWGAVEQHHARMLRRLGPDGSVERRASLWRGLRGVYGERLGDSDRALMAAEQVVELGGGDLEDLSCLDRLMADRADLEPARVRTFHRHYLAQEPRRVRSLRALRRVELRDRRPDAAWWLCHRLDHEGDLQAEEEAFLENLRRPGLPSARRALTDDLFASHLRHPDLDPDLERILALVCPAVVSLYAVEPRKVGIRRKSRIAGDPPLLFVRALAELSETMGMPEPPVAHKIKGMTGLAVGPTPTPTLLVGPDMLSGKSHNELAFAVGRALSSFRPAALTARYVHDQSLTWVVHTLLDRGAGESEAPSAAATSLFKAVDAQLSDGQRVELDEVLARVTAAGSATGDVGPGLRRAIEVTCDRGGLLLSEELAVAVAATPADRHDDLLEFAISEEHLGLRATLGIAHTFATDS